MSLETVVMFESTDAGAPVLTGQAGTLVFLLDKCLVDGYGQVTLASLAQTGGVATATTSAAHGFKSHQIVEIAGATPAAYNGKHRITVTSPTAFTFAVEGATASPASGTITAKRPSLGWSRHFASTNQACYRPQPGSNQMYLRVNDNNAGAEQRVAYVAGFESMVAFEDAGNGLKFPTSAQRGGVAYDLSWHKSTAQDATVRPWVLVGNGRIFWLLIEEVGGTNTNLYNLNFFGDVLSYKPGDAYGTVIAGSYRNEPNSGETVYSRNVSPTNFGGENYSTTFLARSFSQIGSSALAGVFGIFQSAQNANNNTVNISHFGRTNSIPYPSPLDNGAALLPGYVTGSGQYLRGVMPGFYCDPHKENSFFSGDMLSNVTGLEGRRFRRFVTASRAHSSRGGFWLDVTGPWT